MRRCAAVGLALAFVLVPFAGAGAAPGDSPEQPGDHPATACSAVVSHGQGVAHESATANAIITS